MKKYKKVLSIAGSDSGGGAGIQADIKAISACGCYAMTAITAVTVQNTVGVRGFHVVPAEVVAGQIAAVLEDIGADAVKLGMLPTDEMIVPIAESLKKYRVRSVVMDPVMVATSGDRLISEAAAQAIRRHIFPLATLVTPNVPEAEYITGIPIRSEADFPAAAAALRDMGAGAVLLKAGHLDGTELTEYLFDGNGCHTFRYPRTDTPNTHGTGCTLSSAVGRFSGAGLSARRGGAVCGKLCPRGDCPRPGVSARKRTRARTPFLSFLGVDFRRNNYFYKKLRAWNLSVNFLKTGVCG